MSALLVTLTVDDLRALVREELAATTRSSVGAAAADSEVLTREQAAEVLQVDPHQITKLVRQGLPMHRLGNTKLQRFFRSEIHAWMAGKKESAA